MIAYYVYVFAFALSAAWVYVDIRNKNWDELGSSVVSLVLMYIGVLIYRVWWGF